jgi:hypothetical protein
LDLSITTGEMSSASTSFSSWYSSCSSLESMWSLIWTAELPPELTPLELQFSRVCGQFIVEVDSIDTDMTMSSAPSTPSCPYRCAQLKLYLMLYFICPWVNLST